MKALREKDQSVSERLRLTLVIPTYDEELKEKEEEKKRRKRGMRM